MTRQIFIGLLAAGLFSCNNSSVSDVSPTDSRRDSSSASDTNSLISHNLKLSGQVYFYAPELDSSTCTTTGACDCCSGNFVFLNDSVFLCLDYCEGSTTFSKGIYRVEGNDVRLKYDSMRVSKEYNMEKEIDTTLKNAPDYFITDTLVALYNERLRSFLCKGIPCFTTDSGSENPSFNVAPDPNNSLTKILETLDEDRIAERLRIRTTANSR